MNEHDRPVRAAVRIALVTTGQFAFGPRSPFLGASGSGNMFLLGVAFELSRLLKLTYANSRCDVGASGLE
jgi:hypothetical protein